MYQSWNRAFWILPSRGIQVASSMFIVDPPLSSGGTGEAIVFLTSRREVTM